MTQTAITEFYDTLRLLLGDRSSTVIQYPDSTLATAVRSAIRMGKAPGYTLSADLSYVLPQVTDPNVFALIVYHCCKLFVGNTPDRYSYRTRAISESFGSASGFLLTIDMELWKLENNCLFAGWTSYCSWFCGLTGTDALNYWPCGYRSLPLDCDCVTVTSTASASGVEISVPFTTENLLIAGNYLLGHYRWDVDRQTLSATAIASYSVTTPTVLQMELNGVLVPESALTIPVGDPDTEATVQVVFARAIPAGQAVRWKVISSPSNSANSPDRCALTMQIV